MVSRTIALVDGYEGGHHETHLRNYAKALLEMGCRVLELLPDPGGVEEWLRKQRIPSAEAIRFCTFRRARIVSPSYRLRRWYVPAAMWREAAVALRGAEEETGWHPDLVFFNWLDDYVLDGSHLVRSLLPVIFPYRWSGVFFHPWHLRAPDGKADPVYYRSEYLMKTRSCAGVAVVDAGVAGSMAGYIGKDVIPFPDETDASLPDNQGPLVRRISEAAKGRRIIGLLGNLSRRKGIVSMLKAAQKAGHKEWLFILVGDFGEANQKSLFPDEAVFVDRIVRNRTSNVFFHGKRIPGEADFNAVANLCDVLFAAYENFGHSSGIVTKAAVFEKPILVSPGFCMAEVVKKYRMGLAVDPHDTQAVIEALEILLDRHAFRAHVGTPDFAGCRQEHSVEALGPAFRRILELI